jgi:hypothetical protein
MQAAVELWGVTIVALEERLEFGKLRSEQLTCKIEIAMQATNVNTFSQRPSGHKEYSVFGWGTREHAIIPLGETLSIEISKSGDHPSRTHTRDSEAAAIGIGQTYR